MKNNFDIKQFLIENKITRNSKVLKESEFKLGPEDYELAKGFNIKYLKQNDTITPEMWDPSKIKNILYTDIDFNEPYKITGHILDDSWDEEGYYTDVSLEDSNSKEIYEVLDNINMWLKPEFQVEIESLDESFELGPDDYELAKGFNNFDITIKITDIYEIHSEDNDDIKKIFGVITIVNTDKQTIEKTLGYLIPENPQEIEDILHEEFIENDLDLEGLGDSKVIKKIPKGWKAGFWNSFNIKVKIDNPLNESFELGPDDYELAKGFDTSKWSGDSIEDFEDWVRPILLKAGFEENDIPYYIMDVDGSGIEIYKGMTSEELIDDFKAWFGYDYEDGTLLITNESFELGPEDYELAKGFDTAPQIQVDVHLIYNWNSDSKAFPSVPDHETTYRLHYNVSDLTDLIEKYGPYGTFTEEEVINKLKDKEFTEVLYESLLELAYEELEQPADLWDNHLIEEWIQDKAYKVFNPINWSKFPQDAWNLDEIEVTADLIKPLNESFDLGDENFELGPEDYELAKGFDEFDWVGETYDEFEEWAVPILTKAGFKLDDIKEYMLDMFDYGDMGPYLDVTTKELINDFEAYLENNMNESFELGPEDYELAKDFGRRKLKVGDYFYDSSNPKFAGAWTKLEDSPEIIRNLVKKIIYIGPNEGQYKEPIYGDDKIVAFEFAINPENAYILTVDSFNEDTMNNNVNAYIPTENLDESFELGPEDYELAKEFSIKFLKIGDIITKDMVRDEFSWFSPNTKWQITGIGPSSYGGDIEFLDLKTKRPKGSSINHFNDEFLKPGYKVELPLGEPVNWDDEDDDDDY
jgi:hypothetical protein